VEFTEERRGDVTVLTIHGDLDELTIPSATERLDALVREQRVWLVVNLEAAELVTSTGVGFLVTAARRTRKLGGDTVLSKPSPLLQRTLSSLQIGDYFKTFGDDDAAIASFQPPPPG